MTLSPAELWDMCRRQLLSMRSYMGHKEWTEYRAWLRTEDPELYKLTELTSRRDE